AILAALLMAGLLMVYQLLFVKPQPQDAGAPPQKKEAPAPVPPVAQTPPSNVPPGPLKEGLAVPERQSVVETPPYRAVLGTLGGGLRRWGWSDGGSKPMVVSGELGPLGLAVAREGTASKPIAFAIAPESLRLAKDTGQGEVKLIGEDGYGLRITDTVRFQSDSYVVEHNITIENKHTVAQSADVSIG